MTLRQVNPCIVGWSALSPLGVGRQAFADGLLAGAAGQWAPATGHGAPPAGYPLAGFDAPALIGTAGTRTLDRMTQMVIATTTMVLDEYVAADDDRSAVGLVLGTSTGSVASITGFLRDTFVQDRPYLVDPGAFPNTVINGAAGRTAIWHGLRGVNSTVAGGHNTGLAAMRYASRMIRCGHADTLLVGSVEELSDPVAWAVHQLPGRRSTPSPMGEGCVVFLMEAADTAAARGRRPLARLVDFEFAVAVREDPNAIVDGLTTVIETVLARSGIPAAGLWLLSLSQSGGTMLDAAELEAVDRAIGPAVRRITASRQVGDSFSALGAFQVAAALAVADSDAKVVLDRPAMVTSVGMDGTVACALIML